MRWDRVEGRGWQGQVKIVRAGGVAKRSCRLEATPAGGGGSEVFVEAGVVRAQLKRQGKHGAVYRGIGWKRCRQEGCTCAHVHPSPPARGAEPSGLAGLAGGCSQAPSEISSMLAVAAQRAPRSTRHHTHARVWDRHLAVCSFATTIPAKAGGIGGRDMYGGPAAQRWPPYAACHRCDGAGNRPCRPVACVLPCTNFLEGGDTIPCLLPASPRHGRAVHTTERPAVAAAACRYVRHTMHASLQLPAPAGGDVLKNLHLPRGSRNYHRVMRAAH